MSERSKDSELAVVQSLWQTLDSSQVIKDVVMKGKYMSNSIKFLAQRNSISIEEQKQEFFEEVYKFINNLLKNKQIHRASHVIKNVQLSEFYYLYSFYNQNEDEITACTMIQQRLLQLEPDFTEKENLLKANHKFFILIVRNFEKHQKLLEALNRSHSTSAITSSNYKRVTFETFMKQPVQWRNDLAVDVFFKTKNVELRLVLEKNSFFSYILRNEFYSVLKQWLQEAAWQGRAGNSMKSSMTSYPESFESTLLCLFREWTFEAKMMELIARREKDVIKNDFAKLALFESRESKSICRKLNRFFTTKTFHENFPRLKTDQVTKFVIENSLMDLLPESFIDFRYLSLLLENLDVIYMREELVLIEKMINLMSPGVNLQEFLAIAETTTAYISRKKPEFDKTAPIMRLVEIMNKSANVFNNDPEINSFTRNLAIKFKSEEELPTIKEILESFLSINIDFIQDEFENQEIEISFNDPQICAAYGEDKTLNYSNYVQQCQSTFGSYLFIRDVIKNFSTISRSQILLGAEEITKKVLENYKNRELISHMISFLEIFSIDSRKLRCYLRLTKLKLTDDENKSSSAKLDEIIKIDGDLRNVEALEVFLKTKKIEKPERSYLKSILNNGDWYRLVLLAQYLSFSVTTLVQVCVEKFKHRALGDNLVRAVLFDSLLETKKQCKFSKRKRKTDKSEDHQLFQNGKFLDVKRDMFAIILKCDESVSHLKITFEDFQKLMLKKEEKKIDLLYQAVVNDMPVLAVVAAMTNQYELIFCWLAWISLSSDFLWIEKFKSITEVAKAIVQHCIEKGMVQTLDISLSIFYPESSMKILTNFLCLSKCGKFDEMDQILKQFIVKLTSEGYNLVVTSTKDDSINFTMKCLMKHLQANHPTSEQEKFLDILCRSEIAQFSDRIDFSVFKRLCKIIGRTNMQVNFEELSGHSKAELNKAVGRICGSLIDDHQFEAAIEIADLLNLPKSDFVFKYWLHMWDEDSDNKNFEADKYTKYVDKYNLRIEVLISFIKKVLEDLEPCIKKYNMMKFLLRNNSGVANSDSLEYEIVSLYVKLKLTNDSEKLKPLTSEYFDSVILKEKSIIFSSLYELKSIANVDELTISHRTLENQLEIQKLDELIFYLLDAGDFVQVLRIQEMFGRAPEDLRLLVFMMSIAENINSIYDIAKEERKMISNYGLMSNKFNRLTLKSLRTSSANSMSSSPSDQLSESIILDDSPGRNSYRENKETFQALQGLVCKMEHGIVHAQRIALIYRVSLFLNRNFTDIMKMKSSFELLEIAAAYDCENKLLVMSDVFTSFRMTSVEVAEFISKEITACIVRTRFLQFNRDTELLVRSTSSSSSPSSNETVDDIWGFNLSQDLHLILELCPNTTLLGNYLLKFFEIFSKDQVDIPIKLEGTSEQNRICQYLNDLLNSQIISLKKQNTIRVELLIIAHESFVHECSTEGIGTILNLAKSLCSHLASKKSYTLIVKLLCGIGRYREMLYCFETLIKNEQFEVLLGQFTDKQTNGLKLAILSYLNEYHPTNKEYYRMVASHYQMFTELGAIWRKDSLDKLQALLNQHQTIIVKTGRINSNSLQQVEIPYLRKLDKNVLANLNEALTGMIHATEMVSMDNKIDMSIKFSSFCELIAMQIHLVKVGLESDEKLCPCVINQEQNTAKFQYLANYELSVPQMLILMKNIETKIDFAKTIFVRLLSEDEKFLQEYLSRLELTDEMIENVVKMKQTDKISMKQEKMLGDIVNLVSERGLKFRLASLLGLKFHLKKMLNDQATYYYLIDSKYGSIDIL